MALRSVLEVDVDDSKFKVFRGNFEKFKESLAKMPDMWKQVGQCFPIGEPTRAPFLRQRDASGMSEVTHTDLPQLPQMSSYITTGKRIADIRLRPPVGHLR